MPPPGFRPPENPLEESTREVREKLTALRAEVEANKKEKDVDKKRKNIELFFVSMYDTYKTLETDAAALPDTSPAKKSFEALRVILTAKLGTKSLETTSAPELFVGITDRALMLETDDDGELKAGAIDGIPYDQFKVNDFDDEIEALRKTMSMGEKIEDGVRRMVEGIPEEMRAKLDSFGIGTAAIIAFVMDFIAKVMDGVPMLRSWSKQIREYRGRVQAKADGITDAAVIKKGKEEWDKAYAVWLEKLAKNPKLEEEPPDFLTYVTAEAEKVADADKLKAFQEKFDTFATADPIAADLFGGGEKVEFISVGETKAINAGGWKIQMPMSGVEEIPGDKYKLSTDGENFKKMYDALHTLGLTQIQRGAFALDDGGKLTANIDAKMTENHLKRAVELSPLGSFKSVKLHSDAIDAIIPTAKFESGTLYVNYAVLNPTPVAPAPLAPADLTDLRAKAAGVGATTEWTWDGANWK